MSGIIDSLVSILSAAVQESFADLPLSVLPGVEQLVVLFPCSPHVDTKRYPGTV